MNSNMKIVWQFFIITYAITLLSWGLMAILRMPGMSADPTAPVPSTLAVVLFILGGFAPSIAGLLIAWRSRGLRDLLRRAVRFRIGWAAGVAVLLIPLLMIGIRIGVQALRGEAFMDSALLAQPISLVGFTISIFFLGPVSEEFGWRGVALPRLLAARNALVASLILGVFWAFWHLPLFFIAGTSQHLFGSSLIEFGIFAVGVIGLSVIYTWLYIKSGGSLWSAILFHFTYNWGVSFQASLLAGDRVDRLIGMGIQLLLAVIVVLLWKLRKTGNSTELN